MQAKLSKRDERFREQSLNGSMLRVVLKVGAPLALFQLMSVLFSILDTMMASHISAESVSAVAYLAQLSLILSALGDGLSVGAGIMISRAYGEGDTLMVRRRVSSIYALCLALGLGLVAVILPFATVFLRLAGTPEELVAVGSSYFRIQLLVLVVQFLNFVYIAVERARGNAGRIFRLNLLVVGVKLSLTALFVYGLRLGLVSLGVASLVAQLALLAFAVSQNLRGDGAFCFSPKAICFRGGVTRPIILQSIPVIAQKVSFSLGKTVVNAMCTTYGSLMVGAMGVSNNLGGITTNPQNGFQDGSAAIISQNLGAGRYERVLRPSMSPWRWT